MATRRSGRRTLADLAGDPAADDALLRDLGRARGALEAVLRDPAPPWNRIRHVARAYHRWRRRSESGELRSDESEILGNLGFWLFTLRLLHAVRHADREQRPAEWEIRRRRLDRLLQQPAVREAFARLYQFPRRQLDLASVSLHRLGTTSFILRCRSLSRDATGLSALKCLLYPYSEIDAIREATEGYAGTYGGDGAHVVQVYRSTSKWIWMEFIDGEPLADVLRRSEGGARRPPNLEHLRRYGVPLLRALHEVPYQHLDLSPSNVLVRRQTNAEEMTTADVVLIDFGQNYLLTHEVGSRRLSANMVRYVSPELIESRGQHRPTGYEDVYSVGQILLEMAGYTEADGGYIPNALYMDAPFLGRLVEDLLDRDPGKRLLLTRADLGSGIEEASRRELFRGLELQLVHALEAHAAMARVAPTLAHRPAPSGRRSSWGGAWATAVSWLGSLPMMVSAVRRPVELWRVSRQSSSLTGEFDYLFKMALLCSVGWAITYAVTGLGVAIDTSQLSLFPAPQELLQPQFPFVDWTAPLRHYAPLLRGIPPGWERLPGRLVIFTFGITAARYYQEIFSMLSPRRLGSTPGSPIVEIVTRASIFWFPPLAVAGNVWLVDHWLLAGFVAAPAIALNNYVNWRLARRLVALGEQAFSTVRSSELSQSIAAYSEWWKLMAWYGVCMGVLGFMTEVGLARDLLIYGFVVSALNMLKLYRSNCGKLAPALRASLSRSFVTGERLEALALREAGGRLLDARIDGTGAAVATTPEREADALTARV